MSRSWTNARQHYYYYYREKTRQILKHYATMLLVYIEHNDSKQKWQSVYLIQAMEWNVVMYDFWWSKLFLFRLKCFIVVFPPSTEKFILTNLLNSYTIWLTIFIWNQNSINLYSYITFDFIKNCHLKASWASRSRGPLVHDGLHSVNSKKYWEFNYSVANANLDFDRNMIFIKKSLIFNQSLRNFDTIRYTWVPYCVKVS